MGDDLNRPTSIDETPLSGVLRRRDDATRLCTTEEEDAVRARVQRQRSQWAELGVAFRAADPLSLEPLPFGYERRRADQAVHPLADPPPPAPVVTKVSEPAKDSLLMRIWKAVRVWP